MRKRKRKRKRYNEKEIGIEEDREIGSKKRKVEVIIMSQRVVEENPIKYHGRGQIKIILNKIDMQ